MHTLLVLLLVLLYLILNIPVMLYLKSTMEDHKERNLNIATKMVRFILKLIFKATGSTINVKGKENIPDEPVLYVANHRSYFDIVSGYSVLDTPCGYIAKIEMLKVPLLRTWMTLIGCFFLNRTDIREGLKTILAAADQVKNGTSVWIFPEGTRNHDKEMLKFKEGSMKIAEKAGCAIIPVAITGTDDIFENHSPRIKASNVTIQFGKPVYPKELSREERKFLGSNIQKEIQDMINSVK